MTKSFRSMKRIVLLLLLCVALTATAQQGSITYGVEKVWYNISGVAFRNDGGGFKTSIKSDGSKAINASFVAQSKKGQNIWVTINNGNKPKIKAKRIKVEVQFYKDYTFKEPCRGPIKRTQDNADRLSFNFDVPLKDCVGVVIDAYYYFDGTNDYMHLHELCWVDKASYVYKTPVSSTCKKCGEANTELEIKNLVGTVQRGCGEVDNPASLSTLKRGHNVYFNDVIKTGDNSYVLFVDPDGNFYDILENSQVLISGGVDGFLSSMQFNAGAMWMNIKSLAKGKPRIHLQMTHCFSLIKGTIVAFEDNGEESKVWLFAGEVDIQSALKANHVLLKPGELCTVDKTGEIKVSKFNIEDGANKFNIPKEDIGDRLVAQTNPNQNTTQPSSSSKNDKPKTTKSTTKKSTTTKKTTTKGNNNTKATKTTKPTEPKDETPNRTKNNKVTETRGKYARYDAKCGIVKRVETKSDTRVYTTTWWDDYGRLERTETTKREEKNGSKWETVQAYPFVELYIDDKHYKIDHHRKKVLSNTNRLTNFLQLNLKLIKGYGFQKTGTAQVDGRQCEVYREKVRKLGGDAIIEYYVWQGVVLKSVEKGPDGTITTTLESLELPESIKASLFEIPKDYKRD